MSVACVSWLPVTSLPPMSTNQMWLAWLTGLSSSHWQLTLLCVHRDVGKMPPESCLSSFCLCFFNLLFTFLHRLFYGSTLSICLLPCFSFFFFLLSSCIIVNALTDHSPVISVVNVSHLWCCLCLSTSITYPVLLLCQKLTHSFVFFPIENQSLSHTPTIVSVDTLADSVSFNNLYG